MRNGLILLLLAGLSACGSADNTNILAATTTVAAPRPNIILILADDLGYSDLGCYGGEIQTPNLDQLAASGIRFRHFYNTSRCCPTRAALLTGLYNQQAGIGRMTTDEKEPGYRGYLTENAVTLAEVLKTAGYQTAMSGKWHVSNTIEQPKEAHLKWLAHQADYGNFSPIEQYPTHRGFDKYYGNIFGVVDYFDPFSLVSGDKAVASVPAGYYHTDAINDTAVQYIKTMGAADKPYFLYVAHTAPHWPLQALPEDIKKYENTYKVGWDAIRRARYQRMAKLGLIDTARTKLSPRIDADLLWQNNPDTVWDARAMAVHAAMVDRMDQGIGRLLKALDESGERDNTLIIFLSDNGASPENAANYGPGFDRPGETRDGRKIIFPTKKEILPGDQTSFASIGHRWSNVVNTPYRFAKAQSYEGGVRTPMIASWPKGIKNKGGYSDWLGHVMDFMPTFLELSGAKYPSVVKGQAITPYSGYSLVNAFTNKKTIRKTPLFNEHFNARSVRNDNWKLVSLSGDSIWHLYRIHDDETELVDLAGQHPEVVRQLAAEWQQWANTHAVFPKPGR